MDNKLSALIRYKLPNFVRDEHDMFVAFIQAYYTHMEEEGNWLHFMNRYQRNLDVDRADDDFLERYLNEFSNTFPRVTKIPTPMLLKLMREFYLSKGSEDSFRFIFTILYDVEIEIIYPREYLYIPSTGEYTADIITNITGENWFKLNIDNDDLNATLTGSTSGSTAVIDTITSTFVDGIQVSQLEISSYDNDFIPGEDVILTVDDTSVNETVYGAIIDIDVINGGNDYRLSDTVSITDLNGIRAKAKINRISKGAYNIVNIVDGGTGYEVGQTVKAVQHVESAGYGFRARVQEVDGSGAITQVRIEAGGYDYSKSTVAYIGSTSGSGAQIELTGDDVGKIAEIQVTDAGINYSDDQTIVISVESNDGSGAVLKPVLGSVFNAPKRYVNEKSTPSGNSKILDSYYYQQFSYVIASPVSPHKWLGMIKRIAHPAGTQLFGMYQLTSSVGVNVDVAPRDSAAIGTNLGLSGVGEINLVLSTSVEQMIVRQLFVMNQLGSNLGDLDTIKFSQNFDYTIGDYANYTINDVNTGEIPVNKVLSTDITIT